MQEVKKCLPQKTKGRNSHKFEERFIEQNRKIDQLEERVAFQDNTINQFFINLFVPNALFLYPLKTPENLTVFLCFHGVEKGYIGNEWVKCDDNEQYSQCNCLRIHGIES